MKVLTYNIQGGGGGRLRNISAIIRKLRPDVAALMEVGDQANAEALARDLDMTPVFGEANNPEGHVAWLTRTPVRRAENHRKAALAKTLLEVETFWAGAPVSLFATHLGSRWDVPQPAEEIPMVLEVLGASHRPHLLVGDLNALGPRDPTGEPPPGTKRRGAAVEGAPRAAVTMLLEEGYVDCYRLLHPSAAGFTYPSRAPWLRLDYVLASPGLAWRLRACDVVGGREMVRASDHLPVWARFR